MKRLILVVAMFLAVFVGAGNIDAYAAEPVVVVIDPGHGGSNLGTNYLPIPEKAYTMVVALHMKEQLEKYDGVKVYMTHTEDVDMSLTERAKFAESVGADFLFSLHFNMSLPHNLYGSEVWIPSLGMLYSQGYSVANEFLIQFEEMGLFNRGIKTRIGQYGTDYYGIINQCAIRNIPAVIVEHCHVDNTNDIANIQSENKLKEFGVRDAEAVARYFGLVSKDKTVDYSSYAPLAVPVPAQRVCNDTSAPLYLDAKLVDYDKAGRYLTVTLTSQDDESPLQYYAYSIDNGATWSPYQPWLGNGNVMTVTVNMGFGKKSGIIFKVSNKYDLTTVSNGIKLR